MYLRAYCQSSNKELCLNTHGFHSVELCTTRAYVIYGLYPVLLLSPGLACCRCMRQAYLAFQVYSVLRDDLRVARHGNCHRYMCNDFKQPCHCERITSLVTRSTPLCTIYSTKLFTDSINSLRVITTNLFSVVSTHRTPSQPTRSMLKR